MEYTGNNVKGKKKKKITGLLGGMLRKPTIFGGEMMGHRNGVTPFTMGSLKKMFKGKGKDKGKDSKHHEESDLMF